MKARITPAIEFYHAMVYVKDLKASKSFYELLGFVTIDEHEGYARLRSPGGVGTIALHKSEGRALDAPGIRLYFEVPNLQDFCHMLEDRGIRFDKPPKLMEWGWHHAYLKDPDGHEISLFHAGDKRFDRTVRITI